MANFKKILRSIKTHSTVGGINLHLRRNYAVCRLKECQCESLKFEQGFFRYFSQYLAINICQR